MNESRPKKKLYSSLRQESKPSTGIFRNHGRFTHRVDIHIINHFRLQQHCSVRPAHMEDTFFPAIILFDATLCYHLFASSSSSSDLPPSLLRANPPRRSPENDEVDEFKEFNNYTIWVSCRRPFSSLGSSHPRIHRELCFRKKTFQEANSVRHNPIKKFFVNEARRSRMYSR